jgi:hypothetical protein
MMMHCVYSLPDTSNSMAFVIAPLLSSWLRITLSRTFIIRRVSNDTGVGVSIGDTIDLQITKFFDSFGILNVEGKPDVS